MIQLLGERKYLAVYEYCRSRDLSQQQADEAFDWLPVPVETAHRLTANQLGELLVAIYQRMTA